MKFLPLLFLIPLITFAQSGEIVVGTEAVAYDERIETGAGVLYYRDNQLVASEYDIDADGKTDTWLKYQGELVELEAVDTDSDGEADTFFSISADGEVTSIEGEGASQFEKPEIVEFKELIDGGSSATADSDLVGPLDRITIPKHGSFPWWIILLLLGGGGYWLYRKKKAVEADNTDS